MKHTLSLAAALMLSFPAYSITSDEMIELKGGGFTDNEIYSLITDYEKFSSADLINLKSSNFGSSFILKVNKKLSDLKFEKESIKHKRDIEVVKASSCSGISAGTYSQEELEFSRKTLSEIKDELKPDKDGNVDLSQIIKINKDGNISGLISSTEAELKASYSYNWEDIKRPIPMGYALMLLSNPILYKSYVDSLVTNKKVTKS